MQANALRHLIWLLAALAAFVPLSIDTYLPSLPDIAKELSTHSSNVQRTVGVFLAGLCTGMLIYGPLSDRYGRRKLLLVSITIYIVASLGCMWIDSVEQLLILRFVQALGGAGAMVLARTVARDLFPLSDAARILSLMHLIAMLATLIAPIIGTWLVLIHGWRTIFFALASVGSICLFLTIIKLPESHPPMARINSAGVAFLHYLTVVRHPLAVCYMISMSLSVGGMFCFITASSFVYIDYFGFSPRHYSLLFSLNIIGIILATVLNAKLLGRRSPLSMLGLGSTVCAGAGCLLLLLGLTQWHAPLVLILLVIIFMGCSGLVGANCIARLMSLFSENAGAAVGLAISVQFGCGALFSGLVSILMDGSPQMMCLIMGASGVGGFLCYIAIKHLEQKRTCKEKQQILSEVNG